MSPETMAGANAGVGVIGSLFGAVGQIQSGKQEQKAFDYNAQVDLLNTGNELVANEQRYSQLVGKQATAYAASGVDITSGSPLLMMAATAGRGGRQAEQIREAGNEAATLESYYGRLAAWRGKMAGIGTFLSGISKSAQGYLSATGYQPGDNTPTADPAGMNG
jgi:hypothetical protein